MADSKQDYAPLARRLLAGGAALATTLSLALPVRAPAAEPPIKIGVIGEASAVAGASITKAAQMAADDINAARRRQRPQDRDRRPTTTTPPPPTPCAPSSARSAQDKVSAVDRQLHQRGRRWRSSPGRRG